MKDMLHQARALELSGLLPNYGLLMDTGTGKSRVLIRTAELMFRAGMVDTLLVLAPNGPHRDWPDHVAGHLAEDIDRQAAFYSRAYQTKEWKAISTDRGSFSRLRIMSMNVEAISHESGLELAAGIIRTGKVLLAIDESQRIKTPGSRRTKNAMKLRKLPTVEAARIMTGSAITKGVQNLYSQFGFLDKDIIGERTFTGFKARYTIQVGPFKTIKGPNEVELPGLLERLKPFMFQVLADECLDLPPKRTVRHTVSLSDEQTRYYRALKNAFLLELDSGQVIAVEQVVTRMLRLQQILCGHLPDPEEKGKWLPLPCPRLEVMSDLAEGTTQQGIIWARFQPDVIQIAETLKSAGISYRTYFGPMDEKSRANHLLAWRRGEHQWLVATPQTGGVGLTLNEAKTAIFYSNSFSYEHRKQAEARNWRIGQAEPVTYHDLVVPGSIDMRILKAHKDSEDMATVLADVREIRNWLREDTV